MAGERDGRDAGDARRRGRSHMVGSGKVGSGEHAHEWALVLVHTLDDLDQPLVLELPQVPRPDQARLLQALGVEWTVAAVTVTTGQVVVRCALGCEWLFEGEREEAVESAVWHREKAHGVAPLGSKERLPLRGGYGFSIKEGGTVDGLEALERMDRGESQRPLGEGEPRGEGEATPTALPALARDRAAAADPDAHGSSPSPNGRGAKWTREAIIAEIQRYAAEHGYTPSSVTASEYATIAKRLFGSWGSAVEAAGFTRPTRGGSPKSRLLGAAEPARATGATAARPDAAPSGSTEGGGQTEGSRSASGSSRSQGDARVGAAARSPGGASQKKPKTTAVAKTQIPKPAETPDLRDPIRTADIPYDADRLEDEAAFLRRRADAMNELATALRKFEEISSSD